MSRTQFFSSAAGSEPLKAEDFKTPASISPILPAYTYLNKHERDTPKGFAIDRWWYEFRDGQYVKVIQRMTIEAKVPIYVTEKYIVEPFAWTERPT